MPVTLENAFGLRVAGLRRFTAAQPQRQPPKSPSSRRFAGSISAATYRLLAYEVRISRQAVDELRDKSSRLSTSDEFPYRYELVRRV